MNYIHHIQGGVPPRTTFHLFPTFETLIGNIYQLFAPFWTYQCLRTTPKAQYTILDPRPYNAHTKNILTPASLILRTENVFHPKHILSNIPSKLG